MPLFKYELNMMTKQESCDKAKLLAWIKHVEKRVVRLLRLNKDETW